MLSQMLQSAQVNWKVAVEASGWEVMLQLVRLGIGLAVVNGCCRIPSGVVTRSLSELPAQQYFVFSRAGRLSRAAVVLKQTLLDNANAWKDGR
jgi:DNA-binding transcriptional LysR family regulator